MTIHVKCPGCGAEFQAQENLAGKRVKCPKCSAAIAVAGHPRQAGGQAASAEHQTPMIPATCRCGKQLRVKAELAGKRVKCPACGQAFTVADVQHAAAQPDGELDLGQLAGVEASAATTLGAPVSRAKKKEQPSNTRLIIGLSAGGGAVVLVLLLVFLFWPSGENRELAKEEAAPAGQSPAAGETMPATAAAEINDSATGRDEQPIWSQPAENIRPRTYPSFPDALTEAPAWIRSDAPFDVAKFLEAPPPDQNAAPLYLDALLEFSPDVTTCFHEVGQKPDGEILRRAEAANVRSKEYYRLEEAMSKAPASVDNAAVDVWFRA